MKPIFQSMILLLLFAASLNATAQNFKEAVNSEHKSIKTAISGKVTDAVSGEPISGVSVSVPDARTGTYTNASGNYSLGNLPAGRFLVEFSHIGYNSVTEYVLFSGDEELNVKLHRAVTENEGVTVTGVTTATRVNQSPIPVNVFRKKDLLLSGGTNLIDQLAKLGSISQVSTGPAISKPFIRGLGYNRVVTVNDGVRQEGNQWGDEHGIEIDGYSAEKVEVLKGPASLMYGSDALAGVINVLSATPVAAGTVKGNFLVDWQMNNRMYGLHGNLSGTGYDGFNWKVYGSSKVASDFKNAADGYVWNSKFREHSFGGYMGINKTWGFSHLSISRFNQQLGIIEGDRDSATGKFIKYPGTAAEAIADNNDFNGNTPAFPYQHITHTKVTSDNSFTIGRNRLAVILARQINERKEIGDYTLPEEAQLHFDLRTTSYSIQYHLHEINGWRTSAGVNGMFQTNRNKGTEVIIPEYNLFDGGLFVYTQKHFGKQTLLSGGIRGDIRKINTTALELDGKTKFNAVKKDFSNFSASIGFSTQLNKDIIVKANVARGYRAPNLAELFSNGAHEGTNRFEYGTPNLKAETSLQGDAGLVYNTEHLTININAFYNNLDHFIFYQKLEAIGGGDSLVNDNGEDIPAFRFTQANAALHGADFSFDFHPHPMDWLHISTQFSMVKGRLGKEIDGTRNLPMIPATRNRTEIRAQWPKSGENLRNFYVKLDADFVSQQNNFFSAYGTETFTDAYTLTNLGLGTDLFFDGRTIGSVHFAINNLGDVIYQDHLSRLKYTAVNNVTGRQGVFGMGRNFTLKLLVPLNFSFKRSGSASE